MKQNWISTLLHIVLQQVHLQAVSKLSFLTQNVKSNFFSNTLKRKICIFLSATQKSFRASIVPQLNSTELQMAHVHTISIYLASSCNYFNFSTQTIGHVPLKPPSMTLPWAFPSLWFLVRLHNEFAISFSMTSVVSFCLQNLFCCKFINVLLTGSDVIEF